MKDKVIDIEDRKYRNRKKKRGGGRFALWLLIAVIFLGATLYVIMDMAEIRSVIVSGNIHYSREQIIEMVDIGEGANVLDVFFYKEQNFDMYPYIESIDVQYNGFNNLHIHVEEKAIISYIRYQGSYLALDKDGYVIDYVPEIEQGVPEVGGLYIEVATIGRILPVEEAVIRALLDLHHLRQKYEVPLELIDFPYSDSTMVHVYVKDIKMILGQTDNLESKMKNAGEVMKKLNLNLSGTLDLQEDREQFIFKKNPE